MKSLELLKIIPRKDGGHYAYQTKLVWCIVRLIQNAGYENSLKCSRVAVKNGSTDKLTKHHFLIEKCR